jgi:hypothetical protein
MRSGMWAEGKKNKDEFGMRNISILDCGIRIADWEELSA